MIDIHAHFLPGIDDGAKNVTESISMLVESKKQGVDICVGTPHITVHRDEDIENFIKNRQESIQCLEKGLENGNFDIPKLLYGAEIFLDNDISSYKDISKLCIEGTNCILIELSPLGYYSLYNEWIYSLRMKGYMPIIAHVERYPYLEQLISDLDGLDVIYQINAKNLLKFFKRRKLFSLYKRDKKVIIASDMHNNTSRRSRMEETRKSLGKRYFSIAQDVFENNIKEIMNIK